MATRIAVPAVPALLGTVLTVRPHWALLVASGGSPARKASTGRAVPRQLVTGPVLPTLTTVLVARAAELPCNTVLTERHQSVVLAAGTVTRHIVTARGIIKAPSTLLPTVLAVLTLLALVVAHRGLVARETVTATVLLVARTGVHTMLTAPLLTVQPPTARLAGILAHSRFKTGGAVVPWTHPTDVVTR